MEVADIFEKLGTYTGRFPRKAIEEAVRCQEKITPELLRVLEEACKWDMDHFSEAEEMDKSLLCLYAMYLLAQFREKSAHPLVVVLSRMDEARLDMLLGETTTDGLDRILASTFGGDSSLIESLIEDPTVNEYVRAAGISALKILVAKGDKARDEVVAYYKALFNGRLERSYSFVWDELISSATRLHPQEVYDDIIAAFEEGLGDGGYMEITDVKKLNAMSPEKVLKRLSDATLGYIEDTVKEMQWWTCFNREKYEPHQQNNPQEYSRPFIPPTLPSLSKIGPNDPCTCGSGRKYKKCCGRISR